MPYAGELKHRLKFKRPLDSDESTQNSFGEDISSPETVGEFWGKVECLEGRELFAAQQVWAEARYRVTVRYQFGITFRPKMYIEFDDRTLDILSVQDTDFAHKWVVLMARDHV